MDGSSYMSCSNYFDRLRCKARQIDEGIDRLSEVWKTSYLMIGGYADCAAETTAYMEELWDSIRGTNDAMEKFQSEMELSSEKTDEFLKSTKAIYDDLKEQCDNVDIVLTEYGYRYDEMDDGTQENNRNDSEDQLDNSILANEEMSDFTEVEFTPCLTWKCKARTKKADTLSVNQSSVKGIATPVIKSLRSVLQSNTPSVIKESLDTSAQGSNYSKRAIQKISRK